MPLHACVGRLLALLALLPSVAQPPLPLQSFLPAQSCLAICLPIDFLCFFIIFVVLVVVVPDGVEVVSVFCSVFISSAAYAVPARSAAEQTPAEMSDCNCFLVIEAPIR